MRLESQEPTNESRFYACLRNRTSSRIFYERVEPANESGFPDLYFVMRNMISPREGTIELKFCETELPNLKSLCRGNQKAALLDYFEGGGRRRFALCYSKGDVFLWDTIAYAQALRNDSLIGFNARIPLADPSFCSWLCQWLG